MIHYPNSPLSLLKHNSQLQTENGDVEKSFVLPKCLLKEALSQTLSDFSGNGKYCILLDNRFRGPLQSDIMTLHVSISVLKAIYCFSF